MFRQAHRLRNISGQYDQIYCPCHFQTILSWFCNVLHELPQFWIASAKCWRTKQDRTREEHFRMAEAIHMDLSWLIRHLKYFEPSNEGLELEPTIPRHRLDVVLFNHQSSICLWRCATRSETQAQKNKDCRNVTLKIQVFQQPLNRNSREINLLH